MRNNTNRNKQKIIIKKSTSFSVKDQLCYRGLVPTLNCNLFETKVGSSFKYNQNGDTLTNNFLDRFIYTYIKD